jgi:small subunit ribosomal protein S20
MVRTYIKKVLKAVEAGNQEEANTCYLQAQKMIDKAANKGLIHRNTAARTKSRLVARVKGMAA